MRAIRQRVAGSLLIDDGLGALILRDMRPPAEAPDLLYLRYAFVTRGREEHIFPAFLLDDWGSELRSLKLYRWVAEYGERFPRGEIFGFEQDGRETQCFLRELELQARFPCYVYSTATSAVDDGVLLRAILLPEPTVSAPVRIKRPLQVKRPLQAARVSWWQIPANLETFDFALLNKPLDPGY